MKKIIQKHKLEIGQVIPLVVLMLAVIIGMAALILDGGAIMSNRRTAQAAADAGALAGAKRTCSNEADAAFVARQFATFNGAAGDPLFVDVDEDNMRVTVGTHVEHPSFFATIFGQNNLPASAQAIAGCFYPSSATRVLPIAFWYNTPPKDANVTDCSDPENPCEIVNSDFKELLDELREKDITEQPLSGLYFIADSTKVCERELSGKIVCYEMKDNASGGNRIWINLSEVADTNNLKKVITDGVDSPIYLPAWFNGDTGVVASVYDSKNFEDLPKIPGYEDLPYRLITVPVFDLYCEKDPENNCSTDPDDSFEYLVNINNQSYRLVGFAPFVLTCNTKGGDCDSSTKSGSEFGECVPAKTGENTYNQPKCPGYLGYLNSLGDKDKATQVAFEGYFVRDIPAEMLELWGTDGVDVGSYLISLIE